MVNYIKDLYGEKVTFNIMDKATIILTEKGKEVLAAYINSNKADTDSKIDAELINSTICDSLWLIMKVFGQHFELNSDVLISSIALTISENIPAIEQYKKQVEAGSNVE